MRKLLMIPGPIEYESNVLNAMSLPTISHSSPEFISIYREVLENVSTIFGSDVTDSLPVIQVVQNLPLDFVKGPVLVRPQIYLISIFLRVAMWH